MDEIASTRRVSQTRRRVVGGSRIDAGLSDAQPDVRVVEVKMKDEACDGEHCGPATKGDREESEQHHRQQHTAPRRKHHLGPFFFLGGGGSDRRERIEGKER